MMKCCGLVDKITDTQDCDRIPENSFDRLEGGGSSSVEDQWVAQCGADAIMIGIWDNDDEGDFDDIDAAKCCTLDTLYTSGKKIDNDDCAVVNLSANSKFDCPPDYALVGLYDEPVTKSDNGTAHKSSKPKPKHGGTKRLSILTPYFLGPNILSKHFALEESDHGNTYCFSFHRPNVSSKHFALEESDYGNTYCFTYHFPFHSTTDEVPSTS